MDTTPEYTLKPRDLLIAAASYLPLLCIIPFLLKQKNDFIIHHARQGLVLFGIEVAVVLLGIIPFVGIYLSPFLIQICLIVSAWGMTTALLAKYSRIIFIYRLSQKINL